MQRRSLCTAVGAYHLADGYPLSAEQAVSDDARKLAADESCPERYCWDANRDQYLETALRAKFSGHLDLELLLVRTTEAKLIYGNREDRYYGVGPAGSGHNILGRLLVRVRRYIRSNGVSTSLTHNIIKRLEEVEEEVRMAPGNVELLQNLAEIYLICCMYERAAVTARIAVNLDPENEWPLRILVKALVKLNRYDEALIHAHKLVKLDREDWEYLDWLGDIYLFLGQKVAAEVCRSRARRLQEG